MSVINQQQKYDFSELLDTNANIDQSFVHPSKHYENTPIYAASQDKLKTPRAPRLNTVYTTTSSSRFNSNRTPSSALRKRTVSTTCTSSSRTITPSTIVALVEGRGHARGEIGLASLDLKNPELQLSQFPDRNTYIRTLTKLHVLQPLEVIVPNTAYDSGSMSGVIKLINDNFPKTVTVAVQRRYFNETKGLDYIKRLRIPECNATEMIIADKYYVLAAAAALLKYVEFIQNVVYAAKSLKIEYVGGENTTMIDIKSCINLELLLNMGDPKSEHTLFGVLHYSKLAGGTRLLRANILQPPFCKTVTKTRLDCVQELLHTENLLENLQKILEKFVDVDHLLSLCVQVPKADNVKTAENKIDNVIHLKHALELVEPLALALENTECALLQSYHQMLTDNRYKTIYDKIVEIIQPDTVQHKVALNMRIQKCFAVKPNINGLLDVARRIYAEVIDDISALVNQLSEDHGLPLKMVYTCAKGFIIQLPIGRKSSINTDLLPPSFIKVIRSRNMLRFTTEDLMKLNLRVDESLNEIYIMSNVIISKLLEEITQHVGCLYKLAETISNLDMLLAFAQAARSSNYVRPEFTDTLAIKNGRHPILEKVSSSDVVANNAYLCNDLSFGIITGPNMSGKSTYLKQIALLQIMAQMGCYVPADCASFRLADHIYSRAGSSDDIETNSSTFMMEMKEVNYIMNTVTNSSFVVIDEVGRGTSVEESIGICHTICENLIRIKVFVLFATHFLELTDLDSSYPNVINYTFEVENDDEDMTAKEAQFQFSHTIKEGKSKEKFYGIRLATLSLIDPEIIENASIIANNIPDNIKCDKDLIEEGEVKTVVKLSKNLHQVAKNSTLSPTRLASLLTNFQEDFQCDIEELREKLNG